MEADVARRSPGIITVYPPAFGTLMAAAHGGDLTSEVTVFVGAGAVDDDNWVDERLPCLLCDGYRWLLMEQLLLDVAKQEQEWM